MRKITLLLLLACLIPIACANSEKEKKNLSGSFQSKDALSYKQRQGKVLYEKYCSVCHGNSGKGDGFNAYNLDPKPRDFTDRKYMQAFSDERLKEVIIQGGRGVNKSALMPAWGNTLRPYHINYLIDYLKLFSQYDSETVSDQE